MSLPASTRSTLLRPYYLSFDGLRTVAVGLVLLFHMSEGIWDNVVVRWGWVGVDLFFVLSGFLITGILFDSLHRQDFFRNFYTRRSLRIFPLFYAVLFAMLLFGALPGVHVFWTAWHSTFFVYLGNLFIPGGRLAAHAPIDILQYRIHSGPEHTFGLGHLWSLCVEEQFYLVWPAVVWLVRSRTRLLGICGTVIFLTPALRWWYLHTHLWTLAGADTLYMNTAFRADTLMVGAALALYLRGANPAPERVRAAAWGAALLLPALFAALRFFSPERWIRPIGSPLTVIPGFTLIAFAAAGWMLLSLDETTIVSRVLRWAPLVWIGRISYGIYVLHAFVASLLPHFVRHAPLRLLWVLPFAGIAATIALAWLSFHLLESPFLRLKSVLAPRPGAADDPPPSLGPQRVEP